MLTIPNRRIFSLTGSHSTGKSTLLAALQEILPKGSTAFLPEPARHLIQRGYAMNHEITEGGLMMYIAHFLSSVRLSNCETLICDRSILDLLAYITVSRLPQLSAEAYFLAEEAALFESQF